MIQIGLNNLKLNKAGRKKTRRVGRGNSSGRGTYSGRGLKGQRSRSGGKAGLKRRGLKQLLKGKPKIGGFKSLKPKMVNVSLEQLNKAFEDGALVNPKKILSQLGIQSNSSGIKVLGVGKLTKKLKVTVNSFSESAKKAIIDAGGTVEMIIKPKKAQPKKVNKLASKQVGK